MTGRQADGPSTSYGWKADLCGPLSAVWQAPLPPRLGNDVLGSIASPAWAKLRSCELTRGPADHKLAALWLVLVLVSIGDQVALLARFPDIHNPVAHIQP